MKKIMKRMMRKLSLLAVTVATGLTMLTIPASADVQEDLVNEGRFTLEQVSSASAKLPEEIKSAPSDYDKIKQIKDLIIGGRADYHQVLRDLGDLSKEATDQTLEATKIYSGLVYLFARLANLEAKIEHGRNDYYFNVVKVDQRWYCLDLSGFHQALNSKNSDQKKLTFLSGYPSYSTLTSAQLISDNASCEQQWLADNAPLDYAEVKTYSKYLPKIGEMDEPDICKVCKIREFLAKGSQYVLEQREPLELIETKKGNCDAYSKAFYILGKLFNLDVTREFGNNHAFNLVKVDKYWYVMDVCWYAGAKYQNNAQYQATQWNLVSYDTMMKNDQESSHDLLMAGHGANYDGMARQKFIKENCRYDYFKIHNNLDDKGQDKSSWDKFKFPIIVAIISLILLLILIKMVRRNRF